MSAVDNYAADLLARGYIEVQEFRDLLPGSRAKHRNERYSEAYRRGTGFIRRIFRKPNSAWEQSYGRPDIELIFERDDPDRGVTLLADYHVEIVTPEEPS